MEYIYSALIFHTDGKKITEENVTKVLKAAKINVDEIRVKMLVDSLEGVDINSVILSGVAPVVSVKKEEEKEKEVEKKENEKVTEEEAAVGLKTLF
jgi:large subunit ribosomal protein L12